MFCRNCGKELPEEAKFCPNCGYNKTNSEASAKSSSSGKITAINVLTILSMVLGIFAFFIPTIVGAFVLEAIKKAKKANELTGIAVACLICCNTIAGILMLTLTDSDLGE